VILDGKEIRHADVESVSAVSGTGRWLGSTLVKEGSNEIPAARAQLAKLDVAGKIMLADAAHTQVETVRQTLYDQGGDYLLTVKENQKGLFATLATLLTEQRFSPSAHPAHPRPEPGEQPGTARDSSVGLPGSHSATSGLSRSSNHRPASPADPAQG
jgi:predicted transposase YbfD/YdcC